MTFVSTRIYTGWNPPFSGFVQVRGSVVDNIGEGCPGSPGEVIDVGDMMLVPGLIDLHVHGCAGWDLASSQDPISHMAKYLATNGTTAFQPTIGAAPLKVLDRAIETVKTSFYSHIGGARVLGLHMEGPFLSPRKSTMPAEFLLPPSIGLVEKWVTQAQGTINQVTLSPELSNAMEVTRYLVSQGITVSLGHTEATFKTTMEAFRSGATLGNHVFGAMRDVHHKEPGILGALLTHEGASCEMVVDADSVHPAFISMLIAAKGKRQLCLVSNGTERDSVTLNRSLKSLIGLTHLEFQDALMMATVNPARVAGVDQRKGTIAVGKDADLVVLNDDLDVVWSVAEGEIYKSPMAATAASGC